MWLWFRQIEQGRSSNGYGPNPISYAEFAAWAALTGRSPTPFEVECLRALDAVYLERYAEEAAKRRKK